MNSLDQQAPRLCPCCGETLPLGLFLHQPKILLPKPIIDMNSVGHPVEYSAQEMLMLASGRWFVAARIHLPLDWDESPIVAQVWVEIDRLQAKTVGQHINGEVDSCEGGGILACDVPGFPGTMGSKVYYRFDDPTQELPRIHRCSDLRIGNMKGYGGHEGLVELYRRCWGWSDKLNVAPEHPELRAMIGNAWRKLIDRPTFRQAMEPPPRMAGIQPAELLIAPPVDTWSSLAAATLGIAEANPKHATELITFAVNPPEEFLKSFGEFCYWSRGTSAPLTIGNVITEPQSIPGSEEMNSWLLCDPWWMPSWDEPQVHFGDVDVRLMAALLIHPEEATFARERGSKALMEVLERAEADMALLDRPSVIA